MQWHRFSHLGTRMRLPFLKINKSLRTLRLILLIWILASAAKAVEFEPLVGEAYGSGKSALVVIIHGDSTKDEPVDWSYRMARLLSERFADATFVGLLRPGYRDKQSRRSPGPRPTTPHQYTDENIDMVGASLTAMKRDLRPAKVILVGRSGGSAMAGTVAGRFPGIADSIILIGCPCTRQSVYGSRNRAPMDYLGKYARTTRITAITGSRDDRTPPAHARSFVAAANARGLEATFVEVHGATHNFRDVSQPFFRALQTELKRR